MSPPVHTGGRLMPKEADRFAPRRPVAATPRTHPTPSSSSERLLIVGLVLLGLLLAGVLTSIYAPPGAGWAALVAVLVALGIIGSAPDRPMFERAVVSAASRKLTSHVVVEALGARGRLAQLSAPERRTEAPSEADIFLLRA